MLFETFSGLDATSLLAYLDPGLASTQFQILMAAFLSAGFFIKTYFVQVRHFIGRFFNKRVV